MSLTFLGKEAKQSLEHKRRLFMSGCCVENIRDPTYQPGVYGGCGVVQLVIGIALVIICAIGASMHWVNPVVAVTGAAGALLTILAITVLVKTCKRPSAGSIAEGANTTPRNMVPISEPTTVNESIISDNITPALPAQRTLPDAAQEVLDNWSTEGWNSTQRKNRKLAVTKITQCFEQRFRSLDLSNLKLSSLPDNIGGVLLGLETLDLSGNSLTSLPTNIKYISRTLRRLNLSKNDFKTFPKELCALDELRSLNLAQNRIVFLEVEIGQMSNLREVDLSNNQIVEIKKEIIDQINRLSEDLSIDLRGNALTATTKEWLSAPAPYNPYEPSFVFDGAVESSEKGKEAAPADNDKKEKGVAKKEKFLHPAPANLDGLENWIEEATEEEKASRKAAAQQMRECFKSKSAELRLAGGFRLTSLPPEIGTFDHLEHLNLSYNRLTSLPPEIGNLLRLQELDLSKNDLTEFPEVLCNLHDLEQLNMRNNKIVSLPPQIGRISNLKRLILDGNQIASISDDTLHQIARLSPKLIIFTEHNPVWSDFKEGTKLVRFRENTFNLPSDFGKK